jgi:hypothetical protein
MPKIGTLDFTGISGHKYTFNVYPINREHKEKEAVYVVTHRTIKADASVDHELIFIGETDNVKKTFKKHQSKIVLNKKLQTVYVFIGKIMPIQDIIFQKT